ncbi:MAG: hypothetical protein IKT25_04860 [Firmicutes bacterium]|nr:hypothetical protein [Bacillota bacterium]
MDKEQLIEELEAYLNHIIFAEDCLVCYKSILNGSKNYNKQINLSPGFFGVSMNALSKCLFVELAKLFVGSSRTERTMQKLINIVKANQNLFPKTKEEKRQDGNIVIEKINVEEDLQEAESQLIRLKPIIQNLQKRRNKFLAHND